MAKTKKSNNCKQQNPNGKQLDKKLRNMGLRTDVMAKEIYFPDKLRNDHANVDCNYIINLKRL